MELESLKAELSAANQAVFSAEKALSEANESETNLQIRVGEANAVYENARAELASAEEKMSSFSSELGDIKSLKTDIVKKAESLELEAKKLTVTVSRIQKEKSNAEKFVATILKKHPWIESEMSAFGVEGGDYDFASIDMTEMGNRLEALKEEQDSLVRLLLQGLS